MPVLSPVEVYAFPTLLAPTGGLNDIGFIPVLGEVKLLVYYNKIVISKPKSEAKNTFYNPIAFTRALEKIKAGEKILKLSGLKGSYKQSERALLNSSVKRTTLWV